MLRRILLVLTLLLLFLSHSNSAEAQTCTPEEEQKGNQLLALANIYEQQREGEKAAETYAQVALSPCTALANDALASLQRTLNLQENWFAQIQERLFNLSLSTATIVGFGILIFLIAKVLIWYIDRSKKWVVVPFIDLTGNKSGNAIAESLTAKLHEVRLLYSKPPDALIGFSESIDLPSFSMATQKESLLTALSGLNSLDVSGIGLPVGSALSAMIRWLDLGGRRLFGSIQQWDNRIIINVRLEEGRGGKCTRIWKASGETTAEMMNSDVHPIVKELAYQILFDITPDNWGTLSAAAFQSFTDSLEQLNIYYESRSRDKAALQKAKVGLIVATQIDPTYHLATLHLALANINTGRYDEAVTLLKGLLRQTDFQPELYYNLGVAYYHKTFDWAYDQAEKFFDKILDGFSGRQIDEREKKLLALTHCGLTSVAAQRTKFNSVNQELLLDTGESHYRQAMTLASQDNEIYAQAQYSLAILHLNCREYEKAFPLLEDALTHNPYHWRAYTALGQVAMATNQYDDAIASLRKATLLSQGYEYAYYQLGRAYTLSDILEKDTLAIEAFSKAPNIASAHNEMGKVLAEQLGEFKKGINCFERAIELNSRSADAYANLAWYLAEGKLLRGEGKQHAIAAAERAVEITNRNDWHKLAVLGRVYYECQEYEKALLALQSANQLNPEAPQVYYHLAMIKFSEQAFQQARQYLTSFFQLTEHGLWKDKAISLMRNIEKKLRTD